jgi:hypothetical protein
VCIISSLQRLFDRAVVLVGDKDVKVAARAASAAGFLLAGHIGQGGSGVSGGTGTDISTAAAPGGGEGGAVTLRPLLEALFKQNTNKAEELQFSGTDGGDPSVCLSRDSQPYGVQVLVCGDRHVLYHVFISHLAALLCLLAFIPVPYPDWPAVGEAIAYAFGGVPVSADRILLSNFNGLADEFSLLNPALALGGSATAPASTTATAASGAAAPDEEMGGSKGQHPAADVLGGAEDSAELTSMRSWVLSKLLDEMVVHSRAEVCEDRGRRQSGGMLLPEQLSSHSDAAFVLPSCICLA